MSNYPKTSAPSTSTNLNPTATNKPAASLTWETNSISEESKFNIDGGVAGSINPCSAATKPKQQLNVMKAILGECLCEPFQRGGDGNGNGGGGGLGSGLGSLANEIKKSKGGVGLGLISSLLQSNNQFVELHGIQYIGLGAVVDELTPKERVYDTLEQLTSRTERLITIGYLVDEEEKVQEEEDEVVVGGGRPNKIPDTIPLDIWRSTYPNDKNMSRSVKRIITKIQDKNFNSAIDEFKKEMDTQMKYINRGNNKHMAGITTHNMAVCCVLAGKSHHHAENLFQQAIKLKCDAFGPEHLEVAISLDELGIQQFAQEKFHDALESFNEARRIRSKSLGPYHPQISMVLNNIACCNFQMGNSKMALEVLQEARDNQQKHAAGSSAKADLDLLHSAITLSNYGYLKLHLKQYEDAAACFEEALLIQQSVLGDAYNHRAIRDTRSNLDFTNAFHS